MRKTAALALLLTNSLVLADVSMTFSDGSFVKVNDRYVVIGDEDGHGIIEAGKSTFIMVDHEGQTHMEVSESFAEDVAAMMAAQMEEMLADIPPEERAMYEQSMAGGGALPAPPKMNVKKTGKQDTVAGYKCTEIEISYGDGAVEELSCVASAKELGISSKDFASMAAAMRSVSRMVGMDGDDESIMDFEAMGGIPIRTLDLEFGDEEELVSLSKDTLDNDTFAIPAGYRKVSMEDMMMMQ